MIKLTLPITDENILTTLKPGDLLELSGIIYTARDAAHKKMIELLEQGKPLPFDIKNQAIYYTGPTPTPPGKVVGSIGPTTSCRMNSYAPVLLKQGLKCIIGKGKMSQEVVDTLAETNSVYFLAVGGAGAYFSQKVVCSEIIAFEKLGAEAIHKLEVKDFPVVVGVDAHGNVIGE